MATIATALVCPQGHGPQSPGTRFCTFCGVQLVAAMPPVQPLAAAAAKLVAPVIAHPIQGKPVCKVCGGNGDLLGSADIVCTGCAWLRPLVPGYTLDRSAFLWAQDGQAMNRLQQISALNSVVHSASDKVGRP